MRWSQRRWKSRYKPGDNVRFLALALLLGLVMITGGTDGDDNSAGLRRGGLPVSSEQYIERRVLRSTSKALAEVADARLVPLAETPAEARPEPEGAGQTAPQAEQESAVAFFQGYRAGAGQYPEERIAAMIGCESSWRLDPGGWHRGLAQFDPGTWATVSGITGFADPYNAFHQGYNVAVWASMVSPGTTAGWPYCW